MSLTKHIETVEVTLSEPQAVVLAARTKLVLEMAGQGSGKSEDIGHSSGMKIEQFPEAMGFIGANTQEQLSTSTLARVFKVWHRYYGFTEYDHKTNKEGDFVVDKRPPAHFEAFRRFKDYNGIVSFKNGANIFVGSLTNFKAHDGKEFAWAHLDETKDTPEAAIKTVILGRLRQYGLWFDLEGMLYWDTEVSSEEAQARGWKSWNPLFIHTSPPVNACPWLIEMFDLQKHAKEMNIRTMKREKDFFQHHGKDATIVVYPADHNKRNLPPEFLPGQRSAMGVKLARKLVDGFPFGQSGGEWYHEYDADKHVRKVEYLPGYAVYMAWDSNSKPYMSALCSQLDHVTRYWDPVAYWEEGSKREKFDIPHPGLEPIEVTRLRFYRNYCMRPPRSGIVDVCEAFKADHAIPEETEVFIMGDYNMKNDVDGLPGWTRYSEIFSLLWEYTHNWSDHFKPNVGVYARRQLVNDLLAGKYPEFEIVFDEGMTETINDLTFTKEGPKGKHKQKEKDEITGKEFEIIGHTGDCVEYTVCDIFRDLLKT
jgi:hypothetical protein